MSAEPVSRPGDVAACARLVKIYWSPTGETHALRGVEAGFPARTVSAVTGPSGSGKSSLLAVLAMRERPSGGELWLLGEPVAALRGSALRALRRTRIGWVGQRPTHSLFAHLTARQQLEQVARLRGVAPDPAAALERLDLGARAGARTEEMSGGEQQRLAVALAVLAAPALVLADEPTAELDDRSSELVMAELRRCAAAGSAVVFATHDARAVARADRVLHLRHGVLATERSTLGATLAPIDSTGRLQLPPEALAMFPGGRASVVVEPGSVRLVPPEAAP